MNTSVTLHVILAWGKWALFSAGTRIWRDSQQKQMWAMDFEN